jgi:hypothetical protein
VRRGRSWSFGRPIETDQDLGPPAADPSVDEEGTVLSSRLSSNARYAVAVTPSEESAPAADPLLSDAVRDPLAVPGPVLAARRRPMSERLELALSWNAVAAELRAGLDAATGHTNPSR